MDYKNFSQKEQEIRKMAEKYDGLDENSLFDQLLKNVQQAKDNGSFDYGELLSFANNMFPLLSDAQRQKLVQLLKVLKSQC